MIIDFNKQNGGGGGDLSNYWTSAQTQNAINLATEDLVTSGEVQTQIDNSISGISIDLSNYYTSAQTETAITSKNYVTSGAVQEQIDASISGISVDLSDYWTSAQTKSAIDTVENHLDDVERVASIAINDLDSKVIELSGRTVDLSGYYTSAQTNSAINSAIEDFVTSADVQTQIDASISGISVDLSDYWTSAQTQTVINEVVGILQRDEQVTATALNELHNSIMEIINYISGTTA